MADGDRWLVLFHQLPKEPAYLRVKTGRRLARVGAVALKNSVYVLPKSDKTMEDFQWIRREIGDAGGEATVLEAAFVEGLSDADVEAKFHEIANAEYAAVAADVRAKLASLARRKKPLTAEERERVRDDVVATERRVAEIVPTDFFGASGREVVAALLRELATKGEERASVAPAVSSTPPRARTWVTRTGVHVDRIASAWLVRRFIDPEASFKFVPAKGYVPRDGELRFDMFEAEFTHEGDLCTFEVLCRRFGLDARGLHEIAEIVHDIDLKDAKHGRPETSGVAAQIAGLALLHREDETRLARGFDLFDALLAHFAKRKETR